MGESIIEEVKPTRTETRASGGTGGTGSTKSTSSTDTRTTAGGTGGRTGGKTGGEKEVVSTMVDVEEEKRLERNRKRQ